MERVRYLAEINVQLGVHPICGILGPRQVGKTTLARQYVELYHDKKAYFFDLENPLDLARLENPMDTLERIEEDLIIIDEIQLRPHLYPILRVLVDKPNNKKAFLILGSASQELLRQSSETLAGRIGYIQLPPFALFEVSDVDKLFSRGGFPPSFLASSFEKSVIWRSAYVKTFLERDIPQLGFQIPPAQMQRFWMMLAHYHGQTFNASELARSMQLSDKTIRRYLDILAGTFMVRVLPAWFENIKKRQTRTPKIYFNDCGIVQTLLNIGSYEELIRHPRLGSLWEGFALEEVIRALRNVGEWYYWSSQAHAELDLLLIRSGKRIGFEFKHTDIPRTTKSMQIALEDLNLSHLAIVYPGEQSFTINEKIRCYSIRSLLDGSFEKAIRALL